MNVSHSAVQWMECAFGPTADTRHVPQLQSGEAEVFGTSLIVGQPVSLRGQKVAVWEAPALPRCFPCELGTAALLCFT